MLPLITTNMYFDTVLKAIESTLKTESANQITLTGTGWKTVRERLDPWNIETDEFNPGVVNVAWSASNFPEGEGNSFDQTSITTYDVDCYASEKGLNTSGVITPKDQRAADVLHALITRVYYTLMSPIYYDLGLTAGTIEKPWVASVNKFIPMETNISLEGVLAARLSYKIKFKETPPCATGVALTSVNIESNNTDLEQVDPLIQIVTTT